MWFLALAGTILTTLIWWTAYRTLSRQGFDAMAISLGFFAFIFIMRSWVLVLGLDDPNPDYLFHSEWITELAIAQMYAVMWLVAFMVGARAMQPFPQIAGLALPNTSRHLPTGMLMLAGLTLTVLGLLITLQLVGQYGSYGGAVRGIKIDKDLAGAYVLRQAAGIGSFVVLAAYFKMRLEGKVTRGITLFVLFATVLNMVSLNVWGNRENIGVLVIFAAVCIHLFVHRFSKPVIVLGGFGVVAIMVGLRLYRDLATAGAAYTLEHLNPFRIIAVALHQSRVDAFMLLLRDWATLDSLRWGQDFWLGFQTMIPRAVWPGKPETLLPGAWFRRLYEPDRVNGWPFTEIGEWLINFGVMGVFLGGLLSGLVLRAVNDRYGDFRGNPMSLALVTICALLVFQNGLWTQFPSRYILWLIPIMLMLFTVRIAGQVTGRSYAVR